MKTNCEWCLVLDGRKVMLFCLDIYCEMNMGKFGTLEVNYHCGFLIDGTFAINI